MCTPHTHTKAKIYCHTYTHSERTSTTINYKSIQRKRYLKLQYYDAFTLNTMQNIVLRRMVLNFC